MTVNSGATLILEGVGIEVNGAEPRSVIDNAGDTLTIEPNGSSGPCLFTNHHGVGNRTTLGGVLNNRNGGTVTTVTANFNDSTASDKDRAIYDESGSVTIRGGSFNSNNSSYRRGAIDVEHGATLNILSSNFMINDNSSFTGGAIFSDGGIVTMQRDPNQTLASVSIASNKSEGGGAIFALGDQLTIDSMQFLDNSTPGDGGAIWFSDIGPKAAASITHTYFRQNATAR